MMAQQKTSSSQQPSLVSMINEGCECGVVIGQATHCLFNLSGTESCSESWDPISSSRNQYLNALRVSSVGIVSANTSLTDLRMDDERMNAEEIFDYESQFVDNMDIDDILSMLSDDDESTEHAQDSNDQVFNATSASSPEMMIMISDNNVCHVKAQSMSLCDIDMQLNATKDRLHECMKKSSVTLVALQEWDRLNGLPASHSRTMVNTARSRKQLQKGVILKKWNGSPLVSSSGDVGCVF